MSAPAVCSAGNAGSGKVSGMVSGSAAAVSRLAQQPLGQLADHGSASWADRRRAGQGELEDLSAGSPGLR